MKKVAYLLAVLLLAGCQGHKQQALTPKQQQEFPVVNSWAGNFKEAVERKFPNASDYAGKTCTIRVHQPKGAREVTEASAAGGDPGLCDAALAAVWAASDERSLPPSPEPVGENFSIDFKP
ncbi:cell envelope integrity TolA C-terminal domain-containing protein [Enterobacter roggenkampii]|uniref:cell envelope integrity TolA C-terminal domain-containing protein n=1 Tax=Enterobacter roggenkampii TaxID=1812935 RepID=UPI00321A14DB